MNSYFAMRRANGDLYAFGHRGEYLVPIFHTGTAAMTARSQDSRMECFRAVKIDDSVLHDLTTAHEKPGFLLIADPLLKLNRGRLMDGSQLSELVREGEPIAQR